MSFLKVVTSVLKSGISQGLTFRKLGIGNNLAIETKIENFAKVLGGYTQTRDLGKTTRKRRTTHAPRWWVQRKVKAHYEGLTPENKDFLQETIQEKAAKMTEFSPLKEAPWERGVWTQESRRTGIIARKIGIYPMWLKDGRRILTTLLQVVDNHVINYIPPEKVAEHRYAKKYPGKAFLLVGAESTDPQKFTASYNGIFEKSGVVTKRKLSRFAITPDAKIQPGTPLYATHFRVGDYVNVYGKTIGHGFQGVVKRWNFRGGRKTHGTTKSHRRPGAIGAGAGRKDNVWKGKKMPGHMGQERRLLPGLKILRINTKYNVIWVRGPAVPGHVHAFCNIYDTYVEKKRHTENNPPHFPTYYPDETEESLPEDIWDSSVHNFSAPTITFDKEVVMGKK